MPDRIRWHDGPDSSTGHVGTLNPRAFQINQLHAAGEWILTCALTGQEGDLQYGATRDELKHAAEEWLTEFAASLGAVFPEPVTAKES